MIEAVREFDTKEHGKVAICARSSFSRGTRIEVRFHYLGAVATLYCKTFPKEAHDGNILKATSYLNSLTEDKAAQLVSDFKNGFKQQ